MFRNTDILEYTPSELTFFEQMLSEHHSPFSCPNDVIIASERVLSKGICLLILGIAKRSVDMLRSAIHEFSSIVDSGMATIEQQLVVQNNIVIAQKAMLLMESY